MRKIIGMLPEERQTMLFSATQTRDIRDLAAASFRRKPLYLGVDDDRARSTAARLEQGYVMVPADKRFLLLFTFLKKNRKKKVHALCCARLCCALWVMLCALRAASPGVRNTGSDATFHAALQCVVCVRADGSVASGTAV